MWGISTAKWRFLVILKYKSEKLNKIWKFKNPRWQPPLTSFFDYCCHGNQLCTTWFRLIESTNEDCYMYQVSCQSDELCRKKESPIDPTRPLPPRLRVTIFSSRLLGLTNAKSRGKELPNISIYKLGDVCISNNLIGSLSLVNRKC